MSRSNRASRPPSGWLALTALVLVWGACGGEGTPTAKPSPVAAGMAAPHPPAAPAPPPTAQPKPAVAAAAAPTEAAPALAKAPIPPGGRVFVDVSASIRGFAVADDIALESLHAGIGNALSKAGVGPVDYCEIGNKYGMRCGIAAKPRRYRSPSVYLGSLSEIAAALAEVPPDAPLTKAGQRAVGPVDEKQVSVVVTDGIEVSQRTSLTLGETAAGCLPGLDTYCLQRVLTSRAKSGYGVWLHAISLPFKGYIFGERGLSPAMYAAAQAHVAELQRDPAWSNVALEAKVPRRKSVGNGAYTYTGARVLIIIVLSRDIEAGRAVSENLARELELSHEATPAGHYHHAELAPLVAGVQTFNPTGVSLAATDKASLVGKPKRETRAGWVVDLKCALDGQAVLALQSRDDPRRTEPLPASVTPTATVALAPGPGNKALAAVQSQGRETRAKVGCLSLPEGVTEVAFTLAGGLAHDPSSRIGWWWDWTAANTYEQPERVYRLGDLAESVLATTATPPTLHDRLTLRIHREALK